MHYSNGSTHNPPKANTLEGVPRIPRSWESLETIHLYTPYITHKLTSLDKLPTFGNLRSGVESVVLPSFRPAAPPCARSGVILVPLRITQRDPSNADLVAFWKILLPLEYFRKKKKSFGESWARQPSPDRIVSPGWPHCPGSSLACPLAPTASKDRQSRVFTQLRVTSWLLESFELAICHTACTTFRPPRLPLIPPPPHRWGGAITYFFLTFSRT
jgi:hypothetical protein